MGGREVHGPDWNPEWDDADRARGGAIYGRGFFLVLAAALALFLAIWLFSPAADAGQWRVVPAGRCIGQTQIAAALKTGDGRRLRSGGQAITEIRRGGALLELRWRHGARCLDALRTGKERGRRWSCSLH